MGGATVSLSYAKTYPLDRRFAVEFCLSGDRMEARWSPHMPKGRKAKSLLARYRAARTDFIASLDLNVMVIEI